LQNHPEAGVKLPPPIPRCLRIKLNSALRIQVSPYFEQLQHSNSYVAAKVWAWDKMRQTVLPEAPLSFAAWKRHYFD